MDRSLIPGDLWKVLEAHRFDSQAFDDLCHRLGSKEMGPEQNRLREVVQVPSSESWTPLAPPGSAERRDLERAGRDALTSGKVGAVVLNGGMATRFGGVVKGAVAAVEDHSFLELKIRQALHASGGRAWVMLMNSFATDSATRELVRHLPGGDAVRHFSQGILLRVTPGGEIFLDEAGRPSAYAPGHGDLPSALKASGLLDAFLEAGGEYLAMSNVDNLGATLDPAVIGAHLSLGGEMTAEVVAKNPGDAGGAPALVNDRVAIVESFRFPRDFDQNRIPVFNTNTFVFNARALLSDFPLTWFAVPKNVNGTTVIQFERLAGQLSSFLDVRYLLVPRDGPHGRFLPVKDPQDLALQKGAIRELLATWQLDR